MKDALHATWPAVRSWRAGRFTFREGGGGGKRVSAATCEGAPTETEIDAAEAAFARRGEAPLFALDPEQAAFDEALGARGYALVDPTLILAASVGRIAADPPPVTAFTVWPPLQVQRDIWAEGGIGPARLAVMERAVGPKTAILGRARDAPAGTAFVAVHEGIAMVHAVEVRPAARRQGLARHMMGRAARWAQEQGAREIAVLVTEANLGAIALYRGLGMAGARCYQYRTRS